MQKQKKYLTVKQAIEYTKKSNSTIRRLINDNYSKNSQRNNHIIQKRKGKLFYYMLSSSWLKEKYNIDSDYSKSNTKEHSKNSQKDNQNTIQKDGQNSKIIEILERELELKEKEIERLNERISESNKLVENQQILAKQNQELLQEKPGFIKRLFSGKKQNDK